MLKSLPYKVEVKFWKGEEAMSRKYEGFKDIKNVLR